ncbi:MAG: hypothetical protein KJP19_03410 [Deltaproteobacteria bacterium]|nr:hypothetical protein [Deltaproteobacteria bacterium]
MKNETEGYFVPAPLIFKDDGSNWPDIPAQPLDLVLYRDDVEEDRLAGVLTLEPLLRADGSSDAIEQNLLNINTQLTTIGDALVSIPGEHQQYMNTVIETFNQMLTGDCDNCLKTQLDLLAQEGGQELLDALLAQGGLVEYFSNLEAFLTQYADGLAAVQASIAPSSSFIQPAFAMPEQTDVMLAYQMQFYEVAKLFGEEVIAQTGTDFGNTLGLAIGLFGALGGTLPAVTTPVVITGAILFYMDFLVNKIMVGLLPGQLDKIDLDFDALILEKDEVTDSTITIHASNIRPQLTLNYLIGTAINMMGWSGAGNAPGVVVSTLESISTFLIFTMQGLFTQYASAHPELNLQLNIGAIVPPITWTAKATDERLIKCVSLAPSLLTPMPDELNWQADDTLLGEGRVYVRPALGDEARIVPLPIGFTYAGGAFGNDVINSNIVTLTVAIIIIINDTTVHLGDDALHRYNGTAAIPDASEFTSARLVVKFLGSIPGTSGIDLFPAFVRVVVNGNGNAVTEGDIPNISGSGCSVEWLNLEGQFPAPCRFAYYDCPFTYKLDIKNVIIPLENNSVSIISGIPPSNWCGDETLGYDDFAIGRILIALF